MDLVSTATSAYLETLSENDAVRLRFFKGLWDIQEEVGAVARAYEPVDARKAENALREGRTLFEIDPPCVPLDEYLETLSRVVAYAVDEAGFSAEQAKALAAVDFESVVDEKALSLAASDPDTFVSSVAEKLEDAGENVLQPVTLVFVLVAALTPFLEGPASLAMSVLDENALNATRAPHCPVCGSEPAVAYVGEDTSSLGVGRKLWCELCHTEWEYERIRCARCGKRSQDDLHYRHIEGDETHRLHVCDECHGYIRSVFQANTDKPISMAVEDVVMTNLDVLAQREGYAVMSEKTPTDVG